MLSRFSESWLRAFSRFLCDNTDGPLRSVDGAKVIICLFVNIKIIKTFIKYHFPVLECWVTFDEENLSEEWSTFLYI